MSTDDASSPEGFDEALDPADDAGVDDALRGARPVTAADDGWAASAAGDRTLVAIVAAAADHGARDIRIRIPRRRPSLRRTALAGAALVAAASLAVGIAVSLPDSPHRTAARGDGPDPSGARPADLALVGYNSCTDALQGLRTHTAAHTTAYGLPQPVTDGIRNLDMVGPISGLAHGSVAQSAAPLTSAPATAGSYSTTNNQESAADEPDTVKTDGRRIVTVTDGTLRVTDAVDRKITGTLDLAAYAGAGSAQLLLSGDRVLVLLHQSDDIVYGGPLRSLVGPAPVRPIPVAATASTVLLVDIASTPRVVSTFRPRGELVDARLVNGTARLVVRSAPQITFAPTSGSAATREAANRAQVAKAPIGDWLPSWTVTTGGTSTTRTLGCTDLSHPLGYTGLSTLTVYSVQPSAGFGDVAPVSLVAEAGEVYATGTSLYIASGQGSSGARDRTWIHRFAITAHKPVYLGSGSVPGYLRDSYSMSDYDGSLRVVTHDAQQAYGSASESSRQDLYVLNADTLAGTGHIPDLGKDERLYAVRFLGPIAYVVTFRQIDPLYVLDLHDPRHPTVSGELTQPGYSSYLHDVGDGRLLGVGESVRGNEPDGLQVSLFDVSRPSAPKRLAQIVRPHAWGGQQVDPHAFLYWAADKLAVLPIGSYEGRDAGAVLALHVEHDALTTLGTVNNPGGGDGISRTLVIGDTLWTLSTSGLQASDTATLHRQAWLPFR